MNPAAILSLISELYAQVSALQQENEVLRRAHPDGAAAPVEDAATT